MNGEYEIKIVHSGTGSQQQIIYNSDTPEKLIINEENKNFPHILYLIWENQIIILQLYGILYLFANKCFSVWVIFYILIYQILILLRQLI